MGILSDLKEFFSLDTDCTPKGYSKDERRETFEKQKEDGWFQLRIRKTYMFLDEEVEHVIDSKWWYNHSTGLFGRYNPFNCVLTPCPMQEQMVLKRKKDEGYFLEVKNN